jgi:hypothetical protein
MRRKMTETANTRNEPNEGRTPDKLCELAELIGRIKPDNLHDSVDFGPSPDPRGGDTPRMKIILRYATVLTVGMSYSIAWHHRYLRSVEDEEIGKRFAT